MVELLKKFIAYFEPLTRYGPLSEEMKRNKENRLSLSEIRFVEVLEILTIISEVYYKTVYNYQQRQNLLACINSNSMASMLHKK